MQQFSEFLKDDIIVAHNANFDVNFLYDSMVRCGMKPIENNFVDTLRLAKCVRPGLRNYKLATLSREYRIPQPTAHRALADCETTFAVLQRLADDAAAQGILNRYRKRAIHPAQGLRESQPSQGTKIQRARCMKSIVFLLVS